MKRVLILVLSHYESPYDRLEESIRNTWASKSVDNIKIFFYHGGSDKDYIDGDKIRIQQEEGYYRIGYKTIRAFEMVDKIFDYDYIFRTNSSSYINLEKLNEYIVEKPNKKFYSGVIGNHFGIRFSSGSGYFLSRDVVKLVLENKKNWNHQLIDDVALGKLLSSLDIFPTPSPRLDIDKLPLNEAEIQQHFHFRCKTSGDRSGDIIIMNELKNKLLKNE